MASVDFRGKCKGGAAAKAVFRHCEKDTRLKGRHKNGDIDRTRTNENTSLYGLDYNGVCEKYDRRIAELDSSTNTNKRKDRVTLACLSIPVPEGLAEHQEDAFFKQVNSLLIKRYGKDNVLDIVVHRDEQHLYLDPDSKEMVMSRTHAHCFVVPELDGKLNGKKCTGRANINGLNQDIDKMSKETYGLPFMTGTKAKSRGKVEEMKMKSAIVTLREASKKEYELKMKETRLQKRELDVLDREEAVDAWEKDLGDKSAKVEKAREEAQRAFLDAERIKQEAAETLERAKQAEQKNKRLIEFCRKHEFYSPATTKTGKPFGKPLGKSILEHFESVQAREQQSSRTLDSKLQQYKPGDYGLGL